MAERERSRLRRLDMTGTDERRNSRSRSGTPTREDDIVPQPVFQPRADSHSHNGSPQGLDSQPALQIPAGFVHPQPMHADPPPFMGVDPFRIYVPAQEPGAINLNDDMPQVQNALSQVMNRQGPLSQEGRHFQWQLPPGLPLPPPAPVQPPAPIQPPVPMLQPAQVVAGVRHVAANRN